MEWIKVTDRLPQDDSQLVLFAMFHKEVIIKSYCDTWKGIRDFRSLQVKYDYTHWIPLPEPPKE